MIFKGPGGYGRIVNIIMNIILCSVLSFYVLWTVQNIPGNEEIPILTPLGFFVSLVTSFCVGMVIGDLVPAYTWGQKFAHAIGLKGYWPCHLVACIIHALIMISAISFICTWFNNVQQVGMAGVMQSWLMVWPFLLVSGWVILVIFLPLAFKAGAALSGFDPAAAPAPEA